jgi:hypothetical protein
MFKTSILGTVTQESKEAFKMLRPVALILAFVLGLSIVSSTASAQSRRNSYNPYQAEAEYYREFNQRMNKVYRGAQAIDRLSNRVVNYGSRVIRGGSAVRRTYNAGRNYVQRNVRLPRRYSY